MKLTYAETLFAFSSLKNGTEQTNKDQMTESQRL